MFSAGPSDDRRVAPSDRIQPVRGAHRGNVRQITIRSTQMSHLLHEELARAHLQQRLAQAERQRLADYVVRVAKARRHAQRRRRQLEQAQLRLRLLQG